MDIEWHIVARLLVAAGLGSAVGLEREASDQPAGLRTHLAVALGAALFGVISTTGFEEFRTTQSASNIQFDVTRVASLVASGIGFIGAGLIFRQGTAVRNLTTAASIWVVAAIGLTCGVGDFAPGVAAAVIVLVALALLRLPRSWVRRYLRPDRDELRVVLQRGVSEEPVLHALREIDGIDIEQYTLEKEHGGYVISARVFARRNGPAVRDQLGPIAHLSEVETLTVGSTPME